MKYAISILALFVMASCCDLQAQSMEMEDAALSHVKSQMYDKYNGYVDLDDYKKYNGETRRVLRIPERFNKERVVHISDQMVHNDFKLSYGMPWTHSDGGNFGALIFYTDQMERVPILIKYDRYQQKFIIALADYV